MVTETFTAGEDFTVPDGVFSLDVELEGEAGEDGGAADELGGDGGRVLGTIGVTPGESYFIRDTAGGALGGDASRGGDAIDIRFGGTTLSDRIAVAAGAGGPPENATNPSVDAIGGDGGPATGEDGSGDGDNGLGGTQSSGGAAGGNGSAGVFGDGGAGGTGTLGGGGGGAGWYGGGGGGGTGSQNAPFSGGSGGGGSNYVDGLDTVTANERGTSTRNFGQGGLVTITYTETPGAENLAITDTTATSHTLDWDAPTLPPEVDSIDQYRIYRDTDTGTDRVDYSEVGTTPTPGFVDTGLENGTEYHYRIGADLFVPEAEGTITITDFRGV